MAYSNSWRFNQSYQERQEAYSHNVSTSRPSYSYSALQKPKRAGSGFLFAPRGMICPCTPPNTSRSETNVEDYWQYTKGPRYQYESPGSGDTHDTDSTAHSSKEEKHPWRSRKREVELQYLQEPSGKTAPYYRTTYTPVIPKKNETPRRITATKSHNAIPDSKVSQKPIEKENTSRGHMPYLPTFGYIPAVVPASCCLPLRSKSTHRASSSGEKTKRKTNPHPYVSDLPRNY